MFGNGMRNFFAGRYGFDPMFYGLIALQVVLILLSSLGSLLGSSVMYYIFFALQIALFGYTFYRVLSKSHDKRRAENAKFMSLIYQLKQKKLPKVQFGGKAKARSEYYFTSCPSCSANLRLPNKKGKHGVRCPRCGHYFDIKIK